MSWWFGVSMNYVSTFPSLVGANINESCSVSVVTPVEFLLDVVLKEILIFMVYDKIIRPFIHKQKNEGCWITKVIMKMTCE